MCASTQLCIAPREWLLACLPQFDFHELKHQVDSKMQHLLQYWVFVFTLTVSVSVSEWVSVLEFVPFIKCWLSLKKNLKSNSLKNNFILNVNELVTWRSGYFNSIQRNSSIVRLHQQSIHWKLAHFYNEILRNNRS